MIQSLADALFMPWVVLVLLGAGLCLTIRTGVVQVRRFGEAWSAGVLGGAATAGRVC